MALGWSSEPKEGGQDSWIHPVSHFPFLRNKQLPKPLTPSRRSGHTNWGHSRSKDWAHTSSCFVGCCEEIREKHTHFFFFFLVFPLGKQDCGLLEGRDQALPSLHPEPSTAVGTQWEHT